MVPWRFISPDKEMQMACQSEKALMAHGGGWRVPQWQGGKFGLPFVATGGGGGSALAAS